MIVNAGNREELNIYGREPEMTHRLAVVYPSGLNTLSPDSGNTSAYSLLKPVCHKHVF